MTHLSANCFLKSVCTFKNKNAEESLKVWLAYSAIKFVVKRHFKFTYSEVIEKTHIRFCKRYCSLSTNVADFFALGECGRLPLCTKYLSNCVKYWLKLIRMQEYRYPRQCYFMLKRLDEVGRKTWASCVRELPFFVWVWSCLVSP